MKVYQILRTYKGKVNLHTKMVAKNDREAIIKFKRIKTKEPGTYDLMKWIKVEAK
jgi:hypothetical protein